MRISGALVARNPVLRRLLAVAVLAAAIGVLCWVVVVPVRGIAHSQTDWRSDVRHELARERGVAALEESAQGRLVALRGAAIWKSFYRTKGQADVGGALKQDVTSLVASAQGSITSLVELPPYDRGHLRAYGVRLTTSLSIDQLRNLLVALRAQPKYLRVERLTISAPISQPVNANPPLLVKLEIYGYAERGGGAGT